MAGELEKAVISRRLDALRQGLPGDAAPDDLVEKTRDLLFRACDLCVSLGFRWVQPTISYNPGTGDITLGWRGDGWAMTAFFDGKIVYWVRSRDTRGFATEEGTFHYKHHPEFILLIGWVTDRIVEKME